MTYSKRNYQQTKDDILNAAAQLFNQNIYQKVSFAAVASQLGLKPKAIYHYFESKQHLLFECYLKTCSTIYAAFTQAQDQPDGIEKLKNTLLGLFEYWEQTTKGEAHHVTIIKELYRLSPDQLKEIVTQYENITGYMTSVIEAAQRAGEIRDCNSVYASFAINAMLNTGISSYQSLSMETIQPSKDSVLDTIHLLKDSIIKTVLYGLKTSYESPPNSKSFSDQISDQLMNDYQLSQDRMEAFFKTGTDHFNRKGYANTSIDEICAALSVSKGTFYHHMSSKGELLSHCFKRSIAIQKYIFQEARLLDSNYADRLACAIVAILHLSVGSSGPLIQFKHFPALSKTDQIDVLEEYLSLLEYVSQFVVAAQHEDTLSKIDPLITARILTGVIDYGQEIAYWTDTSDNNEWIMEFLRTVAFGLQAR